MQLYNGTMRRKNFDHLECPLAKTLGVIGEWWDLLIIRDLFYRINTFTGLSEDLGVARNILTDRLKKLEKTGIIEKKVYHERPRRYEYRLTEKGKDLYPILMVMAHWSEKWESPDGPAILFRHNEDGHHVIPKLVCEQCGLTIKPADIRPEPGPGVKDPCALPTVLRPKVSGI